MLRNIYIQKINKYKVKLNIIICFNDKLISFNYVYNIDKLLEIIEIISNCIRYNYRVVICNIRGIRCYKYNQHESGLFTIKNENIKIFYLNKKNTKIFIDKLEKLF